MLLSHIVPIPNLDAIQDRPYHLTIAQWYAYPEYAAFYSHEAANGALITLDNGAFEGKSLTYKQLVAIARRVFSRGDRIEIVAPDVLCDAKATLRGLRRAVATRISPKPVLMAVPQGKTPLEYMTSCWQVLLEQPSSIGLSYVAISKSLGKMKIRREVFVSGFLVPIVGMMWRTRIIKHIPPIHLLGMGTQPSFPNTPLVRSCDTSLAAKAAYHDTRVGIAALDSRVQRKLRQRIPDFITCSVPYDVLKGNIERLDYVAGCSPRGDSNVSRSVGGLSGSAC